VITIRDIARHAGVSVSTASLALSGDPRVRATTRERVQAAAAALDYHPNRAARSLSHGRTWSLHLLYPAAGSMSSGFFSRFVRGLHDGARGRGSSLALSVPDGGAEAAATLTRMIRERWADGVVLMNLPPDDPLLAIAAQHRYPHVLVGGADDPQVPSVDNDNAAVARAVAQRLFAAGCRHLLLLNGPADQRFTRERAAGFAAAHADAGLGAQAAQVAFTSGRADDAEGAIAAHLAAGGPLDGIVAVSDPLAVAALRALAVRGLRVPSDVRVFGMNDDDVGRFIAPSLSTVDLHAHALGEAAAHLLCDQIEGLPIEPRRRLVGYDLIERETSA
jgi:DNA-binding LacI/PurR family transcriptional regulator